MEDLEHLPRVSEAAYFSNTSWRFPEYKDLPAATIQFHPPDVTHGSMNDSDVTLPSPSSRPRPLSMPQTTQAEARTAIQLMPNFESSSTLNSCTPSRPTPTENNTEDDDDIDDYMDEDEFKVWIAQQHEEETRGTSTTPGSKPITRRRSSILVPRNPPITYPFQSLNEYSYNGIRLNPNSFAELQDGDFMKIVHIVKDTMTSEVTLRGFIFRRTKEMNGLLNRLLNEVCWILHVDEDDPREPLVQGVETRAVTEVIGRRAIRLTNRPFPDLSFRNDDKDTQETVMKHRVLVCRYKYLCFYPNAKARMAYGWCEKGLHRLREDECDKRADNNVKDDDLRRAWRGTTTPGGAREGWLIGEKEFLRQEAVSHRGKTSCQSLTAASGYDFPPEDIMQRRGVGSLLCESDLSRGIDSSTTPGRQREASRTSILQTTEEAAPIELDDVVSPRARLPEQRRRGESLRSPISSFNALASESDKDAVTGMFDLSRDLEETSTEDFTVRKEASPQVIEINAKVKTSTPLGTFRRHYQGKITSTYTPRPLSKIKRSADDLVDLSTRPSKKTKMESPAVIDRFRRVSVEPSSHERMLAADLSDSDRTLLHSDAIDAIDQLSTPPKAYGRRAHGGGLLTSIPLETQGIRRRPASSFGAADTRRLNPDNDDVVDLTAPRIKLSPCLRTGSPQLSLALNSRPIQSRLHVAPFPPKAPASPLSNAVSQRSPARQSSSSRLFQRLDPEQTEKRSRSPEATTRPCRTHVNDFRNSRSKERSLARSSRAPSFQAQPRTETLNSSRPKIKRYTFGDCFCGAGGMSRSAINAGLRVEWGFDFNLPACQSYEMNFFGTPIYNVAADQFASGTGDHKVDICHLSPPCQFFSDAHTIQGKDDDMNTASLFAIFNLLQKTKPRVATLEQTSGLIRRHPIFFNAVINMFTSRGFSVRWRVMNCADLGLPQRRMRLFIIASWYLSPIPTLTKKPTNPPPQPRRTPPPLPQTNPHLPPHALRPPPLDNHHHRHRPHPPHLAQPQPPPRHAPVPTPQIRRQNRNMYHHERRRRQHPPQRQARLHPSRVRMSAELSVGA